MNRNRGVPRLSVLIMILALTILACQGVGSFNPFATATPTPTATFTPTVTPSPTPTYTPTNTPTATPLPTGRIKEEQPDGTTLFTDYDGGYQLTFPQNWTAIILEKDDINNALNQLPKQEQGVSDMIESLKRADINSLIRVISFNFKAQQGLYTPNINIAYDTNPLLSALPLKDVVDATAALFPSLKIKLVNSEIKKTSSGIDIGVIESQWTMNTTNGQKINLHQKQIYFKSGEGVVAITFSTVKNATVDLSSDLEKLIESIQLLDE